MIHKIGIETIASYCKFDGNDTKDIEEMGLIRICSDKGAALVRTKAGKVYNIKKGDFVVCICGLFFIANQEWLERLQYEHDCQIRENNRHFSNDEGAY